LCGALVIYNPNSTRERTTERVVAQTKKEWKSDQEAVARLKKGYYFSLRNRLLVWQLFTSKKGFEHHT
jgi:hypothetical protein